MYALEKRHVSVQYELIRLDGLERWEGSNV